MRTTILLLAFLCFLPVISFAQNSDADFLEDINDVGNGSSTQQAITLEAQCDYSACQDLVCRKKVFNDTISDREMKYLTEKYGQKGVDWDLLRVIDILARDSGTGAFYDDVVIRIVATGEKKRLTFDITQCVVGLRKFGTF